jgi:muramoyltetrapeptide carboxypeptidase
MSPGARGIPIVKSFPAEREGVAARKPRVLASNSLVMPFAPASPADQEKLSAGIAELSRLGFRLGSPSAMVNEGYFAGTRANRRDEFLAGLERFDVAALIGVRGGYGSNYLLDELEIPAPASPKIILGFSDLTSLQIYLWQRERWVTFYAPMLAAGLDAGAGAAKGYDRKSLLAAVQTTDGGWRVDLQGEALSSGIAEGILLGGCLTLVETSLGTPWELETAGAILLLEDRGMKPWQVDRALMHLLQASKFRHVRGIVLGDFPKCESPVSGSPTVRDVCRRILGSLDIPIVFGAPVGHTTRPMLTLPLGVKAQLSSKGEGVLEILEPAVVA